MPPCCRWTKAESDGREAGTTASAPIFVAGRSPEHRNGLTPRDFGRLLPTSTESKQGAVEVRNWKPAGALAIAMACAPMTLAYAGPVPPGAPPNPAAFEKGLHKRTGDIAIPGADAVLHLGSKYYFLDAAEAKDVLVKLWGNPPSAAEGVLGIAMPADKTVLDNSWGAVITWNDSGYVTDDDATTADYDKVLDDIRAGEAEDNAERKKQGYPGMHVVGWAQPPSYDKTQHSLIWARDFKIDGTTADTLNYDVRVLGRKGVLSMNMLWDMPHLNEVRGAAADFGKVATFYPGSTYGEYIPKTDKAAGYGLAGLVAAGVGVAVAKKFGLLALLLLFLKKGFVLLLVPLAAAWGRIKRFFGRGGGGDDGGQAGVA